jgi:hypothetical protein
LRNPPALDKWVCSRKNGPGFSRPNSLFSDFIGRPSLERPRVYFRSADYDSWLSRERPRIISFFYYFCPADYVGWLSRECSPIIFVCLFFARDARELCYSNPRHVVCPALSFHQPSGLSGSIEPSAGLSTTSCLVCPVLPFCQLDFHTSSYTVSPALRLSQLEFQRKLLSLSSLTSL